MSMKYLLSYIDVRSGTAATPAQDARASPFALQGGPPLGSGLRAQPQELKQLLTEAQEGIETKNTTHEFYETLERITNELRGMTEHSTAFLARVRKADAPDYFNIIKHPMDLGTILKKVKAQQYKDKKAFKADLDLIWDNCLLYNTLPTHPLRRSANILRNRANHLLEFVTDPSAQTNMPSLHRTSGALRLKAHASRLDALDAGSVINSTAAALDRSGRYALTDVASTLRAVSEGTETLGMDGRSDSRMGSTEIDLGDADEEEQYESDDDFQDIEDDAEDDTIRTRKGLTSLKTQPGGGRNLHLLQGLAAQPTLESVSTDGIQPIIKVEEGDEADDGTEPRSSMERTASPSGTVAPTPSSSQLPIPDLPGTLPGQGSALVARRATANLAREKMKQRRKRRQSTATPAPAVAYIPFPERTALLRTPEGMAKFAELDISLDFEDPFRIPSEADSTAAKAAYLKAIPSKSDAIEAKPVVRTLAFTNKQGADASDPQKQEAQLSNGSPAPIAILEKSRAPEVTQILEDGSSLWWQAVSSDSLARSAVPEVPFAAASRPAQREPSQEAQLVNGLSASSGEGKVDAKEAIWSSLASLQKVKTLHRKIGGLKSQSADLLAPTPPSRDSYCDDEVNDLDGSPFAQHDADPWAQQKALLDLPVELLESSFAHQHSLRAMHAFCATMAQGVGFDGVHRTALDAMTALLVRHLSNIGQTLGLYRDRFSKRVPYGDILSRTLSENSLHPTACGDPIRDLRRYVDVGIYQRHNNTQALAERLRTVYWTSLEEGEEGGPLLNISLNDVDNDADGEEPTADGILQRALCIVEPDHLGFASLGINKETSFDVRELNRHYLRRIYPDEDLDPPLPFSPPLPPIPLTAPGAISHQIGLLAPFLTARAASKYGLYDDSALPTSVAGEAQRILTARPEASLLTGRILQGKRKRELVSAPTVTSLAGTAAKASGTNASTAAPSEKPSSPKKAKANVSIAPAPPSAVPSK